MITSSYVPPELKELEEEIIKKKLIFLCEAGLDPGIDHIMAKMLQESIKKDGGKYHQIIYICKLNPMINIKQNI